MQIVDTFLFSEPYERNVLLTKFHVEDPGVNKFIGIECEYTFRGEKKGCHLQSLLDSDNRFEPFRNKVHVISIKENLFEKFGGQHGETGYFKVEFAQRGACFDYLKENFPEDTRVIISDTDEMLDFSHPIRNKILFDYFNAEPEQGWAFSNSKFWWDFDNLCFWPDKTIPTHCLRKLIEHPEIFSNKISHTQTVKTFNPVLGFEYAYCFSRDENWRKLNTFAHDRYDEESLDIALACNHWHRSKGRNEVVGNDYWDFFEKIKLNEGTAPKYVLDNISWLKTNIVAENYLENRMKRYGVLHGPFLKYV